MRRYFRRIGAYNKAIVALIMALIYFLNSQYGIEIPLDETSVTIILLTISSFVTWLVPNTKNEEDE